MPVDSAAAATALVEDLHAWEAGGAASPEALAAWVGARLAAHEASLAALLAVEGPRTAENSLRFYDSALEHLTLAGAQAGILNSVAAVKAVRDQAQMEAQRVAMAGSALSLNRAVYEALAALKKGSDQSLARLEGKKLPPDAQRILDKAKQYYGWYDYLDSYRLLKAIPAS